MSDNGNERNRKAPARKVELEAPDTSHEREDERVTEQDKFGNAAMLAQMDLEQSSSEGPPRGAADVAFDHFFDNGGVIDIDDDTPLDAADLPLASGTARRRREEEDPSLEALLAPGLPPEDAAWISRIRTEAPQTTPSHPLAPPAEILAGLSDRWLRNVAPLVATSPLRAAQLASVHPPPARLQGQDNNPLVGLSISLGLAGALLRDLPAEQHPGIAAGLNLSIWASLSASPWRSGESSLAAVARHVNLPPAESPRSEPHPWYRRVLESAMALSTVAAPQLVVRPQPAPPADPDDPLDIDAILARELPSSVPEDHLHLMARESASALAENAFQIHRRISLAGWSCCIATRSLRTAAGVHAVIAATDQHLDQALLLLREISQATFELRFTPIQLQRGLSRAHKLLRIARTGAVKGLSAAVADGVAQPMTMPTLDTDNPVIAAFSDGQVLQSLEALRENGDLEAAAWLSFALLGRGTAPDVPHVSVIQAMTHLKDGDWDSARQFAQQTLQHASSSRNGVLAAAATLIHLEAGGKAAQRDEVGRFLASTGAWVALSLLARWTPAANN